MMKEKRCPKCNALLYESKIKKGSKAGKIVLSCPLCFLTNIYPELSSFDFWKKPGKEKEDNDRSE